MILYDAPFAGRIETPELALGKLPWAKSAHELVFESGFAWDGCSGPTLDTPDSMRAGLAHDGLYRLMRMGLLDRLHRRWADEVLYQVLRQDGMGPLRAQMYWLGVRGFAAYASKGER